MIGKNQIKQIKQLEQKKYRRREGLFVAEGPKVVNDLLNAGFKPEAIYATERWDVSGKADISNCLEIVRDDELKRISFLQHPQNVLALFPTPPPEEDCPLPTANELSLILDGVQDPGNLGTIIRIADWFGIPTIYCSEDTADAWSPKVVQATMGSIARVKLYYCNLKDLLKQLPFGFPVYGTFLDGDDIYQKELTRGGVLIMGNEGNGISEAVRQHVTSQLLIPNFHKGQTADSLNVAIATALACSEFRRRHSDDIYRP